MNAYEKLYQLLNDKKNKIVDENDLQKAKYIEKMLKDKMCFFSMDIDSVVGIFNFLGVKKEDAKSIYNELISFDNYQKYKSKTYECIDLEEKKKNEL